jgi:TetR/AcrR family transcriptional regulator, transcriptional repressor for nem operon
MPRPKSFDEDTVLDQAVQLFWERGYEGTSLADLESHLGLGRQSLYNAFGDKQTLFHKALERYRQSVTERALAGLRDPEAGLAEIHAFFKAHIESLTAPGTKRACLVANTILERGSQDASALVHCNHARADLERVFRRVLTQAKSRREVGRRLDVEATAMLLVTQVYGLTILAKAGATEGELQGATETLLRGLR